MRRSYTWLEELKASAYGTQDLSIYAQRICKFVRRATLPVHVLWISHATVHTSRLVSKLWRVHQCMCHPRLEGRDCRNVVVILPLAQTPRRLLWSKLSR